MAGRTVTSILLLLIGVDAMALNSLLNVASLQHKFFALRHGQSLANVAKIVSSDPKISTVSHGLSEAGKDQAARAGIRFAERALQSTSRPLTAVYSSDFKRARETAEFAVSSLRDLGAPPLENDIRLDVRLRERYFGELNGGPDTRYQDVWDLDGADPDHVRFDVESVNSVLSRTTRMVLDIDEELTRHSRENGDDDASYLVLLVAHGDVLQILQTGFDKMDGSLHRSVPHLETATLRELRLA